MALKIHFLNVGHGDTTIIEFSSRRKAMIDINDSDYFDADTEKELKESIADKFAESGIIEDLELKSYKDLLVDPVEYYIVNFAGENMFRFVFTHPDMDHLSGLNRLMRENISIINFWDTHNNKKMNNEDFNHEKYEYKDWLMYEKIRKSEIMKVLRIRRGEKGRYYNEEEEDDGIYIWSPNVKLEKLAEESKNYNHLSYILYIVYGASRIVLGGDATTEAWEDFYDYFHENNKRDLPRIDILKASHHGRKNGYHQPSVKEMSPKYTIVSVGKKPSTDASNLYNQYSEKVFSTRFNGTIIATCFDNGEVSLVNSKGERLDS